MLVVDRFDALERGRPAILTIGAFDGVHLGHQFLIRQMVERAHRLDYLTVVVTFDPRPEVVLRPGSVQMTDAGAKERVIAALGVDVLVVMPFSEETSRIAAGRFLADILEYINLREIWVGGDFGFGYKREGTVEFLIRTGQEVGFAVHVLPREPFEGIRVSSSIIRELITTGDVLRASVLLGHFFSVTGIVVRGHGRGRALGFPTANVDPPPHQLLPSTGIYAGYAWLGSQCYDAAISVGYNPQFEGQQLTVEAYLLDVDLDLYDRALSIQFVDRVREERRFESVEALVAEMRRDVTRVREILPAAREPGGVLLG